MRLQLTSLGAVHLVPNLAHTGTVQGFVNKIAVFNQAAQMFNVEFRVNYLVELCFDFGLVALANGFNQQFAERAVLEHLAKDIKDSTAQGFALLRELLQKAMEDVSLARFNRDKIPQMTALGLADAVDSTEALLDAIGVPREVVIHHEMRATLKIDAFAGGIGGDQNQDFGVLLEGFLYLTPAFAGRLTMDGDDVTRVAQK